LGAAAALVVFVLWLVQGDVAVAKALVAAWLVALPLLGVGVAIGWSIARIVALAGSARDRGQRDTA
jgi:hypothetical protein